MKALRYTYIHSYTGTPLIQSLLIWEPQLSEQQTGMPECSYNAVHKDVGGNMISEARASTL